MSNQLRPLSGMLSTSLKNLDYLRKKVSADTPSGEAVELLPNGMPLDRTVCPDCLNDPRIVADCATCSGFGAVCPFCRGAGIVNVNRESERSVSVYRPCDCMVPDLGDDGKQRISAMTGRARYRRDAQREIDAIARFRDRQ